MPVATHIAETPAEDDLVQHRSGPFVPFLVELGVWEPEGLWFHPARYFQEWRDCPHPLFVHTNYLDTSALTSVITIPNYGTLVQCLIPKGASIVYCPRTHAAFGHPPHPFRDFLARGVRVALGTDSLASNPDLDLLAEARFLHARYPDVPGATLLRMATLSGAEALGWADETGSLTPGKSAELVVLPLPDVERPDPHELVLASALPVRAVLFCGKWVHSAEN
jgi:cytosine/adenosine deaminase-related metal-dependent hydrolase